MVPIIAPDGSNNPGGNDYAFGGAQTGPTNVNAGSLIDLVNQAADFSAASPSGALFTLDIGANDIGNALTAYAANPTTFDLSAFLTGAIENTVGAIDALYVDGMRNLLYFEVPDLSVVPAFNNPGKYGFANVTDPCFSGDIETSGTECSDPDKYLFWDKEHPTAAGYALTAELADAVLTGAPNPITAPEASTWAMMLIGFGGLGLAGWRRSRRAPVAS